MNKDLIEKIRERTMEQIIQEREDAHDQEHQISSIEFVIKMYHRYLKWYCKKNQPKNYLRLMCRKPDHEHWKNVRDTWNCRLQVFKGSKFEQDVRMTAYVYEIFSEYITRCDAGWKPKHEESELYEYRVYENQNAK
jgi:hypothetical protein